MYGRKIQLVKKKKSGLTAPAKSTGSNWGPRIALYEREQQQLLEESTPGGNPQSQYGGSGGGIYGQHQFKNPCAINGGRSINGNNENNYPFHPGLGKYIQNQNGKPLKVIIPPPEQFHYEATRGGVTGKIAITRNRETDSMPSTETWRSSEHEDDSHDMNSMTRTTVVPTDDEDDDDDSEPEETTRLVLSGHGQYEPLCKCDSPVNRKSQSQSPESRNNGKPRQQRGGIGYPTSAAMAQGFSMVYVPMETSVRRPKLLSPGASSSFGQHEGQSLHTSLDTPSSLTTEAAHSQARGHGSKATTSESVAAIPKDPDNDSLLESFDSVIFNPKLSPATSKSSPKGNYSKNQSTPPPLPPKNPPLLVPPSERKPAVSKNLRFADNVTTKRNTPSPQLHIVKVSQTPSPHVEQKTQTQTVSSRIVTNNHNNKNANGGNFGVSPEVEEKFNSSPSNGNGNGNYVDDDANFCYTTCKSESELLTLSCGHARDGYSTLSSIQSDTNSNSNSKVTEKSALQQLRDLSVLIGGSFHTPEDEQTILLENELLKTTQRKSSDATSADSGKGSANDASNCAEAAELISSNSNCSCAESPCIFRPECEECQMFFKNPFEKAPQLANDAGSKRRSSGESSSSSKNSKKGSHSKYKKNPKNDSKLLKPLLIMPENMNGIGCACGACDVSNHLKCAKVARNVGGVVGTKTQFLLRKSEGFMLHKKNRAHSGSAASKRSPGENSNSSSGGNSVIDPNLFTIDEEASIADQDNLSSGQKSGGRLGMANNGNINSCCNDQELHQQQHDEQQQQHFHPKCWLAPDATMGWSDLESLYSQNLKREQPIAVNGECWTCWKEMSQYKYNGPDSNRTVDRTKRMFIWLNKRPKEFNAPWWEAKKQASIKWLTSKAYAHLPSNAGIQDPFKESKRDKTKYRLREEIISGLANGKLYCMALDNLYQRNREKRAQGLSHWEIIKILSRKGVYVAQPSDMKLTEGTLRQKKPLRIAAHIALIEAIMGLYAKELVSREKILPILTSFGEDLQPDAETPEHFIISWINSAINTIKAFIVTNNRSKSLKLSTPQIQRWLRIPPASEIRDLNDGVGICCLLALYFSGDLSLEEIGVGAGEAAEDPLNIYEMILNHSLAQKLCQNLFPENLYHLCVTDFLYIHGYMKQNILSFLVDLFYHLEVNPVARVNRLTHVPLRVQL